MTFKELNELITDNGYEDVLLFDSPSYVDAFIGISDDNRAIYDFDLMVECLIKDDDIDASSAIEFIEYNTLRALPYYKNSPIIKYSIK